MPAPSKTTTTTKTAVTTVTPTTGVPGKDSPASQSRPAPAPEDTPEALGNAALETFVPVRQPTKITTNCRWKNSPGGTAIQRKNSRRIHRGATPTPPPTSTTRTKPPLARTTLPWRRAGAPREMSQRPATTITCTPDAPRRHSFARRSRAAAAGMTECGSVPWRRSLPAGPLTFATSPLWRAPRKACPGGSPAPRKATSRTRPGATMCSCCRPRETTPKRSCLPRLRCARHRNHWRFRAAWRRPRPAPPANTATCTPGATRKNWPAPGPGGVPAVPTETGRVP
mmetsp:Transcript_3448/g.7849  ORF Transcript_3448/g.7849 Transcript_3448/m.7849 type:complete len:283 (+) Transcript_3448:752-1600(+)